MSVNPFTVSTDLNMWRAFGFFRHDRKCKEDFAFQGNVYPSRGASKNPFI